MATCVGPPDTVALGSFTTLIGSQPAARLGDLCGHRGTITPGCPTVLFGWARDPACKARDSRWSAREIRPFFLTMRSMDQFSISRAATANEVNAFKWS